MLTPILIHLLCYTQPNRDGGSDIGQAPLLKANTTLSRYLTVRDKYPAWLGGSLHTDIVLYPCHTALWVANFTVLTTTEPTVCFKAMSTATPTACRPASTFPIQYSKSPADVSKCGPLPPRLQIA